MSNNNRNIKLPPNSLRGFDPATHSINSSATASQFKYPTQDPATQKADVLKRGSGTPVYLEYVNTKRWQELTSQAGVRSIDKKELQRLHENFDIIFLDFYSVLANPSPGFIDLMHELGFSDIDCVITGLKSVRCGGNFVYVPDVKYAGRYSPYRKYVSSKVSINRFVNKLFRLRDKGVDYLVNIDLTIPKDYSYVYAFDDDFLKLLKRALKLFIKDLQDHYEGELGYFYNIHIWGTRSLDPHFHIHLSLCNAVFKDGKFVRFRPYFNVEIIRELWAECLRKAGLKVDNNVDIKIRYCKLSNRAGVVHRVKYASRHPLVDIASFYADKEFDGFNGSLLRRWYIKLIHYINRRVCGGFLRKLSKIVGDVEVSRCCPVCGKEVSRAVSVDVDGLVDDFVDGSLIVVYWDVRDKRYYMLHSNRCDLDGLLRWFDFHRDPDG
jgi:hypothetical protein